MRIDNNARQHIFWRAELTFDPVGTSVKLRLNDTLYDMTWVGTITTGLNREGLPVWRQIAQSDQLFIGSSAARVTNDVQLPPDKYMGEPIVHTTDGQDVPCYPAIPVNIY